MAIDSIVIVDEISKKKVNPNTASLSLWLQFIASNGNRMAHASRQMIVRVTIRRSEGLLGTAHLIFESSTTATVKLTTEPTRMKCIKHVFYSNYRNSL